MKVQFRGKDINGHYCYGLLTKKKIRNGGRISWAIAQGTCTAGETIPVSEPEILVGEGYEAVKGVVEYRAKTVDTGAMISGGYYESEGKGYIVRNFQFTQIDKATLERSIANDWKEVTNKMLEW